MYSDIAMWQASAATGCALLTFCGFHVIFQNQRHSSQPTYAHSSISLAAINIPYQHKWEVSVDVAFGSWLLHHAKKYAYISYLSSLIRSFSTNETKLHHHE